jgi:hypothetical protein
MGGIPLGPRRPGFGQARDLSVDEEFRPAAGPFGVDLIDRQLQPFGVLIHLPLNLFDQVAVDVVPAVGRFGEFEPVPLGNIPLDELDPEFAIILHDMRRVQFDRMLKEDIPQ